MYCHNQFCTNPIVIHAPGSNPPGGDKLLWNKLISLKNSFLKSKQKSVDALHDVQIITWNNTNKKGMLELSLDHLGVPYVTLGQGIKKWQNFMKIELTINQINKLTANYIIGIDSFDALVINDPNIIIDRFKTLKHNMIFNYGITNFPPIGYPNLNAGVWVGKKETALRLFSKSLENKKIVTKLTNMAWREQPYIKYAAKLLESEIGVDSKYEIFQVINRKNFSSLKLKETSISL